MAKFTVTIFLAVCISSAMSENLISCLVGGYKNVVDGTIPNVIESYKTPESCAPISQEAIVKSYHKMGKEAVAKCNEDLICILKAMLEYNQNLGQDGLACAKMMILDGPIWVTAKSITNNVRECLKKDAESPMPWSTILKKLLINN